MTAVEANAALGDAVKNREGAFAALDELPEGTDLELAARVAVSALSSGAWGFARARKSAPAALVRALLRELAGHDRPIAILVRELVDAEAGPQEAVEQWRAALQVLLDLESSYGWGSKQNKAKLRALASTPRVLAALQAAASTGKPVSLQLLAVLAIDGSEASCDALLPHFAQARDAADRRLDRLAHLKTHAAATPGMRALLEHVQRRLADRQARSPALALAEFIGVSPVKTLWFSARLESDQTNLNRLPFIQGSIDVDSREAEWFRVWVSEVPSDHSQVGKSARFGSSIAPQDGLGLGTCTAEDLPGWLARAAQTLEIRWLDLSPRTNLRGRKGALRAWLTGRVG